MNMVEVLDFLSSEKTRAQATDKFGRQVWSCLNRLEKKGLIRSFDGANPSSEKWHARTIVKFYIATGKMYYPRARKLQPRCPCCGAVIRKTKEPK